MLSVVIPTLDEEVNIAACLDAFDGFAVELIVVDNFSTDRTREIAAQRGAKVFVQGPERCAQRNRGWREAAGDRVLFLDADMIVPSATIEEILSSDSDFALYVPEIRVGDGLRIAARNFERSFYDGTVIDGLRVVPRKALEQVDGYDETLIACEDWDLDRRLKAVGVKTRMIRSSLVHNEERQSLRRLLAKKAYYSTSVRVYRDKWRNDAVCRLQFGFAYRYFGVFFGRGGWRRLLSHPLLTTIMFFERVAVGVVYLFNR